MLWDCKYCYSETERTFDTPQDWTRHNARTLSLCFYGDPNNDAGPTERTYVALQDANHRTGVIPYDASLDHLKDPSWQQWTIALADFDNLGIDTSQIKSMAIGFGNRGEPTIPDGGTPGGAGLIFIDDIRLYRPEPARP
jgi:hypothetical protein